MLMFASVWAISKEPNKSIDNLPDYLFKNESAGGTVMGREQFLRASPTTDLLFAHVAERVGSFPFIFLVSIVISEHIIFCLQEPFAKL